MGCVWHTVRSLLHFWRTHIYSSHSSHNPFTPIDIYRSSHHLTATSWTPFPQFPLSGFLSFTAFLLFRWLNLFHLISHISLLVISLPPFLQTLLPLSSCPFRPQSGAGREFSVLWKRVSPGNAVPRCVHLKFIVYYLSSVILLEKPEAGHRPSLRPLNLNISHSAPEYKPAKLRKQKTRFIRWFIKLVPLHIPSIDWSDTKV